MDASTDPSQVILFVGGLSGSEYIFDRLKETFSGPGHLMDYDISVLRPHQDSSVRNFFLLQQ